MGYYIPDKPSRGPGASTDEKLKDPRLQNLWNEAVGKAFQAGAGLGGNLIDKAGQGLKQAGNWWQDQVERVERTTQTPETAIGTMGAPFVPMTHQSAAGRKLPRPIQQFAEEGVTLPNKAPWWAFPIRAGQEAIQAGANMAGGAVFGNPQEAREYAKTFEDILEGRNVSPQEQEQFAKTGGMSAIFGFMDVSGGISDDAIKRLARERGISELDAEVLLQRQRLDQMTPEGVVEETLTNYGRQGSMTPLEAQRYNQEAGQELQEMLGKGGDVGGDFAGKKLTFVRNPKGASNFGSQFGQDIEPAGKYINLIDKNQGFIPEGFEKGEIEFKNPLVINWGEGYESGNNWKNVLSKKYGGKTGKELSKAIVDDGYDGIITLDNGKPSEVVSLKDIFNKAKGGGDELPDNIIKNPKLEEVNTFLTKEGARNADSRYYSKGKLRGSMDKKGNIYFADANKMVHPELDTAVSGFTNDEIMELAKKEQSPYFPLYVDTQRKIIRPSSDFPLGDKMSEKWVRFFDKSSNNIEKALGSEYKLSGLSDRYNGLTVGELITELNQARGKAVPTSPREAFK